MPSFSLRFIGAALPLILAVVLSGCATHEKFIAKQRQWIGKAIRDFIAQEGYPDRSFSLPDGHRVYVYESNQIYSVPRFGYGGGWYTNRFGFMGYGGVDVVQAQCKLFLETNKQGTIVKWGWRGNACKST